MLAAGAGALLVLPAPALALEQKLVAPDGATFDFLGYSVAVDGDTAVVGAPGDDGGRGAVYVFARTADSCTQTAKLTAADGAANDVLGYSVAIDADTIIAGARLDDVDTNTDQGSASIFFQAAPPPPPPPPPPVNPCGVEGAAGYLYPAKLRVSRSRVLRSDRRLDVYAPITSRARGEVKVTYQGDRRTKTFAAKVTAGDATLDRIRFKEPITAGQARLGTGIVTLNYQGDANTRPEEVRLRAASQHADLDVAQISLLDGRLSARGSVTSRAKGIVRLRYSYLDAAGQPQIYPARATIQANGDWELKDDPVPPQLASCGGYLSILFTGYFERRIRGEMLAYQLDAGQTRRP